MAHFAKIDENNLVQQVIVVSNEDCGNLEFPESESIGQTFINHHWMQMHRPSLGEFPFRSSTFPPTENDCARGSTK